MVMNIWLVPHFQAKVSVYYILVYINSSGTKFSSQGSRTILDQFWSILVIINNTNKSHCDLKKNILYY